MNLNEFREALKSDATERCEEQEKTIKELHRQLKEKDEEIAKQKDDKRALMNRCKALTRGALCLFCTFQKNGECKS